MQMINELKPKLRLTNAKIYRIPLNLGGYYVPQSAALSGRAEIYINSVLPDEQQSQVIAMVRKWLRSAPRDQLDRIRIFVTKEYLDSRTAPVRTALPGKLKPSSDMREPLARRVREGLEAVK